MKQQSKTDWDRVKQEAASDAPIAFDAQTDTYDPNDAQATSAYWKDAVIRRGPQKEPTKKAISLRIRPEALEQLRCTGKGWQTRAAEVLEKLAQRMARSMMPTMA
jgi:uncharacterized protein (DUF4415 family)